MKRFAATLGMVICLTVLVRPAWVAAQKPVSGALPTGNYYVIQWFDGTEHHKSTVKEYLYVRDDQTGMPIGGLIQFINTENNVLTILGPPFTIGFYRIITPLPR